MHEKESRKVTKILSIQDQLHDYGMASAKARLAIKSRQNHIMLDSGKTAIPYSNNFFRVFKLTREQAELSAQAHFMVYTQ